MIDDDSCVPCIERCNNNDISVLTLTDDSIIDDKDNKFLQYWQRKSASLLLPNE